MNTTLRVRALLSRSRWAVGAGRDVVRAQRRFCPTTTTTGDASPGAGRMSDLSGLGPKRFYEEAGVMAREEGECLRYVVTVDGKAVKTPKRHVLATPSEGLSTAIAGEWDAQEGRIRPSSMPLTGLACAALDVVPEFRGRMESSMLRFLHTDTVCIRPATPRELVKSQDEVFEPIVRHCEKASGSQINVARGSLQAPQQKELEEWLTHTITTLDHWSIAAMDSATGSAKSILVAAALRDAAVSPEQALAAARSEELWQAKVWGVVEGGHDMDDADAAVRLGAANMVFRFVDMDLAAFGRASEYLKQMRNGDNK